MAKSMRSGAGQRGGRLLIWVLLVVAVSPALIGGGCPQVPIGNSNGHGNGNGNTNGNGTAEFNVAATQIANGFTSPVGLVDPGDGTGRLFVVDQIGTIWVIDAGGVRGTPLLDLRARISTLMPGYDERGLLGLAFHPDFADNGKFYVFYTIDPTAESAQGANCDVVISEWLISANDASQADELSERILLRFSKPQFNHNGGQLDFGPDGFLYISVGDGGGANDNDFGHTADLGNGQDKSTLLGKILRIDVNRGDPYAIPASNPFADDAAARPEIYAFGLRNPWRFSFDTSGGTTRLFAGDAGQDLFEEINLIVKGGNYGWNIREGEACFDPDNPTKPPTACATKGAGGEVLVDPILVYSHSTGAGQSFGSSAVGGFVYRGAAIPSLAGKYVFGDFTASFVTPAGKVFVASEANGVWSFDELLFSSTANGRLGQFVLGFGRDSTGELYVLTSSSLGVAGQNGAVWKLTPGN